MTTQTTLFSPRTAMAGVYHSSNRSAASLNTDEDGARHRVAFTTRMGMRVGGRGAAHSVQGHEHSHPSGDLTAAPKRCESAMVCFFFDSCWRLWGNEFGPDGLPVVGAEVTTGNAGNLLNASALLDGHASINPIRQPLWGNQQ